MGSQSVLRHNFLNSASPFFERETCAMKIPQLNQTAVVNEVGSDTLSRDDSRGASPPDTSTKFIWGAGIECSFIPHLNVDQFAWTQHDRFWKDDFALAVERLGLSALR